MDKPHIEVYDGDTTYLALQILGLHTSDVSLEKKVKIAKEYIIYFLENKVEARKEQRMSHYD